LAKILADENIPKSVVSWLRSVGHDVVRSSEIGLKGAVDRNVIKRADEEGRVILTLDMDFASLYHQMGGFFGVVIVRVHPATPARIKSFLERVFVKVDLGEHAKSLIIASEKRVQIIRL
jgi:predicted nuclease of predicted toxin-antitoxin system